MSGLNQMVTGGLRPEVDQATLQVMALLFIVISILSYILVHTVIDNSSTVTVNSEENIVLSCVESTATDVVWLKDGVEMIEQVRVIGIFRQLTLVYTVADNELQ